MFLNLGAWLWAGLGWAGGGWAAGLGWGLVGWAAGLAGLGLGGLGWAGLGSAACRGAIQTLASVYCSVSLHALFAGKVPVFRVLLLENSCLHLDSQPAPQGGGGGASLRVACRGA